MDLLIRESLEAMSTSAAGLIADALRERPASLLGIATGATPTRTYELLVALTNDEPVLGSRLRALTIDEWGGLPVDDPATCHAYAREHLIRPLEIDEGRYTHFSTDATDPVKEARRIGNWLAENGPIDLCVLGLGINGHVALVEPATELVRGAHVAALSQAALEHSMLEVASASPTFGLTLGIDELLNSRRILLLVSGTHKQEQLARLLDGPISTEFPASLLWLHPNTTLLCDRAASASIEQS
ncbi:MAG: 6-phosphogluconolactonase [Gaiellaceae bacterium]